MKKLSREEFQEIIHDIAGRKLTGGYGKNAIHEDRESLTNEWRTGGQTGGSCYDEGESSYHGVSGEPEPEFNELDDILLKVAPNMSFLHYKKLSQYIQLDERTENDYYGNYDTYAIKLIKVNDIWNFLLEYELIEAK